MKLVIKLYLLIAMLIGMALLLAGQAHATPQQQQELSDILYTYPGHWPGIIDDRAPGPHLQAQANRTCFVVGARGYDQAVVFARNNMWMNPAAADAAVFKMHAMVEVYCPWLLP